jgi:hypothetical protein
MGQYLIFCHCPKTIVSMKTLSNEGYIETEGKKAITMMYIMALCYSGLFLQIFRPFLQVTDMDTIPF